MSFIEQIKRRQIWLAQQQADPFKAKLEAVVKGVDAMSTNALLQVVGLPKTTGNSRRIAKVMRELGFIPLKSRRLAPGGFRDSVTRGWSRPFRQPKYQSTVTVGETVEPNSAQTLPPPAAVHQITGGDAR